MIPVVCLAHPELSGTLSRLLVDRLGPRAAEFWPTGGVVAALEQNLRTSFLAALPRASPLLRGRARFAEAEITLLNDWAEGAPLTLAGFSPGATAERGVACFSFSSRVILNAFYRQLGLPPLSGAERELPFTLESIWIHELVHLADWANLSAHAEAEEDAAGDGAGRGFFVDTRSAFGDLGRLPASWALLHIIAHFRNEGLANLYEHLVVGRGWPGLDGVETRCRFRSLLYSAFPVMGLSEQPAGLDPREALDELFRLGYTGGIWLVLDCLSTLAPAEARRAVSILLESPEPAALPPDEAAALVSGLLDADISHFLRSLVDPSAPHPWGEFLTADEILQGFGALLGGGGGRDLVARASLATRRGDRDGFVAALRPLVGDGMEPARVRDTCRRLLGTPSAGSTVSGEYFALLGRVFAAWERAPGPLAHSLLSYALLERDLVPDSMGYVGRVDDVLLMEAGLALLEADPGKLSPTVVGRTGTERLP